MDEVYKKIHSILQSSRQIFAIAINCLQKLSEVKDNNFIDDKLEESINSFKIQLGKYHKILLAAGPDKSETYSEALILEHKKRLLEAKNAKNIEGIIEVLLSLRVNALQVLPIYRTDFINSLIRQDVLNISTNKSNSFVLDLLALPSHILKHGLCALISIVASTSSGVTYLIENGTDILQKSIETTKEQTDGSVTQRFCIAFLQKISLRRDLIEILVKNKMIDWIIKLLETALTKEVHEFSIYFGSALLANILRSDIALQYLESSQDSIRNVLFLL